MGIRFLHASDLHLGAYQTQNPIRAYDFIQCLNQIFDIAIREHVNFILWGGDIFDSQELLPNILINILEIIERFHQKTEGIIPIIAVEGNHDLRRYYRGNRLIKPQSWLRVLANRKLIVLLDGDSSDTETIKDTFAVTNTLNRPLTQGEVYFYPEYSSEPQVRIIGYRYLGEQCDAYLPQIADRIIPQTNTFTILLLHCGIQGQMTGVPGIQLSSFQCLRDRVNYLGLGHFHLSFRINGWIFNPGSSEAKNIIESHFHRGIFLIDINDQLHIQKVRQIPLVNRRLLSYELELNKNITDKNELEINFDNFLTGKLLLRSKSINESDLSIPQISITLRGIHSKCLTPSIIANIRDNLIEKYSVIDVLINDKTQNQNMTLTSYLTTKIHI